jgi:hypothetical protein
MLSNDISPAFARVTAYGGVLGALCLLASTLLFVTEGGGINDGVLGGTVGVWSCIGMAIGSIGICRLLESRAPKAAPVVGAVALAGFVGGAAFSVQAMYLDRYDRDLLADVTEGKGAGSDWFGFFAFLPWGWMVPVSLVLVGWLIWRTQAAANWVGALFVLGGVLFVIGRPARLDAVAVATDVVLVLAFAAVVPYLLRAADAGTPARRREDATQTGQLAG